MVLQAVKAAQPECRLVVMAKYAHQAEMARQKGADEILMSAEGYAGVARLTGARYYRSKFGVENLVGGFDVIYDTVGTARTLNGCLRWARAGGAVVLVGVEFKRMHVDLTPVWYQEISLIGSLSHGLEQWPLGSHDRYSTFAIAAELMARGLIHPEKLITHRFALTDFPTAFSTADGKARTRAIKVVFDYDKMPASVVPNVRSSARLRLPVRPGVAAAKSPEVEEPVGQQYQFVQPFIQSQPAQEEREWEQTTAILARFLAPGEERS